MLRGELWSLRIVTRVGRVSVRASFRGGGPDVCHVSMTG